LFFSCCESVAAHFKHAATRRQHREAKAAGIDHGTTAKYMQKTTSGAASNGLYTTIKYLRSAAGIGLGTAMHK
jgi:hypothetical protein